MKYGRRQLVWAMVVGMLLLRSVSAQIIVAEGEKFIPKGTNGWAVTHMDDSYASHNYGGMWLSQGGCLGAPAESIDAVASQKVTIPAAGEYRVWSKYQSPPYFNYVHKIEILQNDKIVYSHVYGKSGTMRMWSFSTMSDELWWFWGIDHDAAEAPAAMTALAAGPAEIRLSTMANPAPAGDRYIDFVLLTTNKEDAYQGYNPYAVASPFLYEAMAATPVYLRYKNSTGAAAKLSLSTGGHLQPDYGRHYTNAPAEVAPGEWSQWFDIAGVCRLAHDEGVTLSLTGAASIPVQVARDAAGSDIVGDTTVQNDEDIIIPVDITWSKAHRVMTSREHAARIVALCKEGWRTNNGGKKPKLIPYYGDFRGKEPWVLDLKDALGYNTLLPDNYDHLAVDGYHQHSSSVEAIKAFAGTLPDKSKFRTLSFGDEISLGEIDYNDPAMQTKFVAWLKQKGLSKADLGVEPDAALLKERQNSKRIGWYAQMFNEEERFASFREMTRVAKELIGPQVQTGANYSPHHMPMYYGPIYQWVDIFKHNGMTMFWGEDYIFSVPMVPQTISWMIATMHCAVKYNNQLIHMYVMPHAPGQRADFLRRNMVFSIGAGVNQIDNFWMAPAERFTENFIAWDYTNHFRAVHESIYDSAAVEQYQVGGKLRSGRVAIVLSKATDHNERLTKVPKDLDKLVRRSKNADAQIQQIMDRVDAQMIYLALKHGQHGVDLITEDDILEGYLKNYDVVYFAGEWIDHRVPAKLEPWITAGGTLYACAGCGIKNEFGEPEAGLLKILGLKDASSVTKDLYCIRPLLELPAADPIDTITLDGQPVKAMAMKQVLVPDSAKVLGTWPDGKAAVTVRELGKGKAFAVGTLPGVAYMKSGLKALPVTRGGNKAAVCPTSFDATATKLVRLGVDAKPIAEEVVCSNPYVEANVIDNKTGTLVTLVSWTLDLPVKDLKVTVRMPAKPASIKSITTQKDVPFTYENGKVTFTTDLAEADYFVLSK